MTDDIPKQRRRSSSITEYSQIFSQNAPRPASFIGQKRHPSLSLRTNDRSTSISKIQSLSMAALANNANESAIDDTEPKGSPPAQTSTAPSSAHKEDAVGLGRKLSQGARAIMYNGNRLRGESVTQPTTTQPGRSLSIGSTTSTIDSSNPVTPSLQQDAFITDGAKQIKRKMSPTGERMLRGELAFH